VASSFIAGVPAPGPPRPDAAQGVAPGPFGIMIFSGTERPGYLA